MAECGIVVIPLLYPRPTHFQPPLPTRLPPSTLTPCRFLSLSNSPHFQDHNSSAMPLRFMTKMKECLSPTSTKLLWKALQTSVWRMTILASWMRIPLNKMSLCFNTSASLTLLSTSPLSNHRTLSLKVSMTPLSLFLALSHSKIKCARCNNATTTCSKKTGPWSERTGLRLRSSRTRPRRSRN